MIDVGFPRAFLCMCCASLSDYHLWQPNLRGSLAGQSELESMRNRERQRILEDDDHHPEALEGTSTSLTTKHSARVGLVFNNP